VRYIDEKHVKYALFVSEKSRFDGEKYKRRIKYMKEDEKLKSAYQPEFYNPKLGVLPEKKQKDFLAECIAMLNRSPNKQFIIKTFSDVGNHDPNQWICTVKEGRVAKTYDDLLFTIVSL
jgi:hypothetical protein